MKILLDESLPGKLRSDFGGGHLVSTVRDKGWLGKKSGDLLNLITENNFDLFITVDRNLRFQQNLQKLSITIIVLCAVNNRRETLQKLIPKIFETINENNTNTLIEIF